MSPPPHAAASPRGKGASRAAAQEDRQVQALEAEVQRLRQELARARSGQAGEADPHTRTTNSMVWVALAVCGIGLLFALLAVLNHG